jgi:hypothetical protein
VEETRDFAAVHDPPAAQASHSRLAPLHFMIGRVLSETPYKIRYSHISLCLFYSSLTKFMLLVVLAIWGPQVRKDTSPPAYVYKIPFEGPLWHLLDDDVLDRTWLVRNLLGGVSAGFGLRSTPSHSFGRWEICSKIFLPKVVLDCHPLFTSLVILSGCLIKTGIVSIVREFVGPGNGVEETWLAYSIP